MFRILADIVDSLVSDVTSNVKGRRFSRALWLDVEAVCANVGPDGKTTFLAVTSDHPANCCALVLRGMDKVKADSETSSARDGEDAKLHNAQVAKASEEGVFWTTAEWIKRENFRDNGYYDPRPFVLALSEDRAEMDQIAAELIAFYADSVPTEEGEALAFSARMEGLTDNARHVLPILLAVFGAAPNSGMLGGNRLGSFADYLSGRAHKAKSNKPPRKSAEEIERELHQNLIAKMQESDAFKSAPAAMQAQMLAILAQQLTPAK